MRCISFLSLLLCVCLTACTHDHRAKSQDHISAAPVFHPQTKPKSTGKVELPPTEIVREGNLLRLNYDGFTVDRGHQVPANHLDASAVAIKQSNYMTNILPQTSQMNRGTWKLTEEIVECYRDIEELLVIGGVIWGNNPADDYFVETHGMKTPDAFWKVIVPATGG